MFASVLQEEAKKIAGKKSTKAKAKKRRADDPSDSDSSDETSVDNIEQSDKETDETDEDQTYQDMIANLGSITNDNWNQPVESNKSSDNFNDYTNECYVTAVTLFQPI